MGGADLRSSGMAKPTTPQSLRILLADDHQMVRDGIRRLIESEPGWSVIAEADNGRDAVALVAKLKEMGVVS